MVNIFYHKLYYLSLLTIIFLQIDYSDQDNTLSVSSNNTNITLTNLVSGINYFINVTAFTDTGEITTNSISVATSKNAVTSIYPYVTMC